MILDDRLVAAGDEDEMLDAGLARLLDDVLDDRPIDDREHLLRHGFGGRQKPRAEAGDGKTALRMGFIDDICSRILETKASGEVGKAGPSRKSRRAGYGFAICKANGPSRFIGLSLS